MPVDEATYRAEERRLWRAMGLAPVEAWIRLAHSHCTVRVQEVGEGPPVLFLHGGPSSGASWAPLVRHLTRWRCLLLDRPGTGLSEPLRRSLGPRELCVLGNRIVGDVLDAVGITRAHVVASSIAGFLALRSAARHPEHVDRMVQLGCPAFVQNMAIPRVVRLLMSRHGRWIMRHAPTNVRSARMILRRLGHQVSIDTGRIPQGFVEWYVALINHTTTLVEDGELIGALGSPLTGFSSRLTLTDELLAGIHTPTLFYWGEDDTFGDALVARQLVRTMPAAELVMVPFTGHLPWLDDPARCARAIDGFLRRGPGLGHEAAPCSSAHP